VAATDSTHVLQLAGYPATEDAKSPGLEEGP